MPLLASAGYRGEDHHPDPDLRRRWVGLRHDGGRGDGGAHLAGPHHGGAQRQEAHAQQPDEEGGHRTCRGVLGSSRTRVAGYSGESSTGDG